MRKFLLALCLLPTLSVSAEDIDTSRVIGLQEIVVIPIPKEAGDIRQQPSSVTLIGAQQMADHRIHSLKHISALVPNFFIPDYGSRLTSAVYIRGVGSRINTPAVGLYVDNIPYVDKSAFDFNFYDIERVDVLRGPQGTLYGRNTMGGLVRIHTRSPFSGTGTDVKMGFATKDAHHNISLTHYHRISDAFAFSAGGYYEGSNGFFRNDYTGERADKMKSGGGRLRGIWHVDERLTFDFSINYDYSDERAYPYYYLGQLEGTESYPNLVGKISNNRESSYRRGLLNVGLNTEYKTPTWQMNAVTGFQNLNDCMHLDQDFLTPDIYTLEQRQRINTLTEEITFKPIASSFDWVGGINLMYQTLHTTAPVHFYNDGLRWLEGNINRNMPDVNNINMLQAMGFTSMGVNFRGDDLPMGNNFETPTLGLAAFYQATFKPSVFQGENGAGLFVTAGLRLDYEHMSMDYNAPADVDYGFRMPNAVNPKMAVDLQHLSSHLLYSGLLQDDYVRLLPKFALKYEFGTSPAPSQGGESSPLGGDKRGVLYFSLSQGQRSGGYNLQMFSDLLQGALRVDMMDGVKQGVKDYLAELAATTPSMPAFVPDLVGGIMDEKMPQFVAPSTEQVVYKPEYSWNYELGTHLTLFGNTLQVDAATFLMLTKDQQIARFADSGLGRKMVNAGKSRSYGVETSLRWTPDHHLAISGNYGFTHATFTDYDGGAGEDYTGNYIPFVPMHTANLDAAYRFLPNSSWALTIGANCTGVGRIYWTEQNNHSQPFYMVTGARLTFETSRLSVMLWGKNLTGTSFRTFYFESAGRGFEQHGKPFQMGIDIKYNL
ncbi:MAG: TonB-dependent receptor [Bacteroidaceae bacterium]|nr:TonB-dependent receptor [Bacteroidaceae bacterium]